MISQTNKRVLLIDCDMRKGYTHELLGTNNVNGLSEILIGQGDITTAAKPTSIAKFDLIPRGQVPPNPSELLMSERFAELVNWASKNYDLVLIDTPPILAVTDAAIVGRHVGTTLMVARYAVNTLKEVETSLSRFEQNGIPVKGDSELHLPPRQRIRIMAITNTNISRMRNNDACIRTAP